MSHIRRVHYIFRENNEVSEHVARLFWAKQCFGLWTPTYTSSWSILAIDFVKRDEHDRERQSENGREREASLCIVSGSEIN